MKKTTKNYFLGLGTLGAVSAPIAAVVACGTTTTPEVPAEVLKQRELFARSTPIITNAYQEKLLLEISNSKENNVFTHNQYGQFVADDFKHDDVFTSWKNFNKKQGMSDLFKKFVALNIFLDNDYLAKMADKLLKVTDPDAPDTNGKKPLFARADLVNLGLYDRFSKSETDIITKSSTLTDSAKFDRVFKTVWEKNINGFRTVFYKFLITNYYLDTNKTHWQDVFINSPNSTGRINGIEGSIDSNDFVLGQALVKAKLSFNWKADLSEDASRKFIGKTMKEAELDTAMTVNGQTIGEIAKDLTLTQQKAVVPSFFKSSATTTDKFWNLLNENANIASFTGVIAKDLAKDEYTMRQVTDKTKYDEFYYGYNDAEKSELIKGDKSTFEIKLTTPSQSKVSIEKNLMIMPIYDGSKLSLDFFNEGGVDKYATLKTILFMNGAGASIYDDAIKYYSSEYCKEFPIVDKNGNPVNDKDGKPTYGIRFNITDKNLRDIAIANSLSFVQKVD